MNAHAPLVHYNAACVALAAAKSTDEVKDWRDKAEAMRAYAHQSKNRCLSCAQQRSTQAVVIIRDEWRKHADTIG